MSTHNNRVPCGEHLEALEVVGKPVNEFVSVAYGTVFGHGGNNINLHVVNK